MNIRFCHLLFIYTHLQWVQRRVILLISDPRVETRGYAYLSPSGLIRKKIK